MFIAPSLLYWRDEQTDTFKGGKRANRGAKKTLIVLLPTCNNQYFTTGTDKINLPH